MRIFCKFSIWQQSLSRSVNFWRCLPNLDLPAGRYLQISMYVCTLQRVLLFDQRALLFSSYSPTCAYYYVIKKNVRFWNIVTLTRLQIFVCQNHLIDRLHHLLSGRLHLHLNATSLTCEGLSWIFKAIFSLFSNFQRFSSVGFCQVSVMPYLPFVSNIHQSVFLGAEQRTVACC